ncbi:MAG: hypothetical protein NTU88_02440 [Armatimonadetes bacterium]|nr:hypothetical protein [Armatimonadota bacterium]
MGTPDAGTGCCRGKELLQLPQAGRLSHVGFQVRLLEYYDENGVFHFEEWDPDDGYISRSKRYDPGHSRRGFSEPFTSIIIDAVKS